MNRFKIAPWVFLFVLLPCLGALATSQKWMSVQVKEGHVRSSPSFLGKIVMSLVYGDRVAVREEKGAWARVGLPGKGEDGWLHASALSSKKIVLKASAADVEQAATSDELALAGKGFSKQVEGEFRSQNRNLEYAWIDKMEQMMVSQAQIQQFLKEGDLLPEGGAP